MDIEAILRSLNSWGRYQVVLLIIVNIYGVSIAATHLMSFIYIMDTPVHFCKPYEGFNKSEAIPISKKYNNEITEYESCSIYKLENGTLMNETTSCPNGNEYLLSEGESTVVNELELVCGYRLMANTAISVYFCGVLLASLICGLTSDYLGRRNVFLTASILLGITGIGLTFTESYFTFCVVWFLCAIGEQCVNVPSYILLMEMFPPEKRAIASASTGLAWGVAVTLLPMYAYLLRDWRHMQIAISAPCLTAILFWCFIHESPRWMLSKGRFTEANEIFRAIAKFNKVEYKDTYIKSTSVSICSKLGNLDELERREEKIGSTEETNGVKKQRTYTIIDVLRRPKMRRNTLITYYLFLVNGLVYYGMAINSSNLYGDKYLNTFLVCLVDLPSGIINIYLLQRFNRRPLIAVLLSSAAMCLFITGFTPLTTENGANLYPFILTSACLGKFVSCSSFSVTWLYGSEIFPTELRNTGFGTCSFAVRIGSIIAPFFMYLDTFYDGGALLCLGVFAIIGCISVYFLPETRNKALPETIEDGEILHGNGEITRP